MNNNVSWRGELILFFWHVVNTPHSEQAAASTGLHFLGEASIKRVLVPVLNAILLQSPTLT